MQDFAKFVNLEWVPSSKHLVQGIKGGRRPKGALAGGNGSFIVGERAQLILTLNYSSGGEFEKDIYYDIKDITGKKLTDKFRQKIEQAFQNATFILERNEIVNLEDILESIL